MFIVTLLHIKSKCNFNSFAFKQKSGGGGGGGKIETAFNANLFS
ncbi:hypothetical protein [Helicobacter japonicus]|nr:hypothetical protein [Helicobacter japonicus]